MKKEKEPMTTSTKFLLVLAIFLLAFIITMIVVFCKYQSVPDTLIQCTMGAGGIEAIALAGIKVSKVIKGEKSKDSEDTPV